MPKILKVFIALIFALLAAMVGVVAVANSKSHRANISVNIWDEV